MKKILILIIIASIALTGCFGGSKEIKDEINFEEELVNGKIDFESEEFKNDDLMVKYDNLVKLQNEKAKEIENGNTSEEIMEEFDIIISKLNELDLQLLEDEGKKRNLNSSSWINSVRANLKENGELIEVYWGERKDDSCYYVDIRNVENNGSYINLFAKDEVFNYKIQKPYINKVNEIRVRVRWRQYVRRWYGTYTYTRWDTKVLTIKNYYETNPNGNTGRYASMKIDGTYTDWSEDMLIAQGVANDDPRVFRGAHEGPVYDLYSLYATWDNENLYLAWQFTNVNDITYPSSDYLLSDNGKPYSADIPMTVAFDIDPYKETNGIMENGSTVWNYGIVDIYDNGLDYMAKFSSKYSSSNKIGTASIFSLNRNNKFEYNSTYMKSWSDEGIELEYVDGFFPKSLNTAMLKNGDTPEKLSTCDYKDLLEYIHYYDERHDTSLDTFYEMKIPLSALKINRAYIENVGIGVMVISTFGESAIGSLPNDITTLDNAMVPFAYEESTSNEKADNDKFTAKMARIGKLN